MTKRILGAALLALVPACEDGTGIARVPDASIPIDLIIEYCNPISHAGCFTTEKCSWIQLDSANGVVDHGCVADGSVAIGEACTYGPDGADTGFDDCAKGGVCIDATCRVACSEGSVPCEPPQTCVRLPWLQEAGPYGACTE